LISRSYFPTFYISCT